MLINWIGHFGQGQGYSGSGENIAIALEELGHDVRLLSLSKSNNDECLTEEGRRIKEKPFIKSDIGICYSQPVAFSVLQQLDYRYRYGLTMFETDKLPVAEVWAGKSNAASSCNMLTRLLVPCEHNKKLFSDSGVTVPIEVVRLGINPSLYNYLERLQPRDTFTFLQLGTLTTRKNPGAVIMAFLNLFADKEDAYLVLKSQKGTIFKNMMMHPHIKVIDEVTNIEDTIELYRQADCFVFPSRGEGFGLPPMEAMATGLPVILSDNTGLSEFCDVRYNYPIHTMSLVPAINFPANWGDVGNWYEPDFQELKEKMWYIYGHREEAMKKGKLASEWVLKNFTFQKTAERLIEVISKDVESI